MQLIHLLFSFKTKINLPWTWKKKQQQQQQQYTASFSFLSFFLFSIGSGGGEHNKGRVTPWNGIQDSLGFWIPRPKFRIPGTEFQTVSEIWILDSNL